MVSIEIYIIGFMIIYLTHLIYKWRNPKCSGKLPPGSSGFPLIGESLELFIPSYTFDKHPFIKKRLQRYGLLFRTNVVGQNVVVSADPDFNRYIFQHDGRLVCQWYLEATAKLFDKDGSKPDALYVHKYMRNLTISHFGTECIKQKLLSQFQELVHKTLQSLSIQDSIEIKYAFVAMYAAFGAKQLFGLDYEKTEDLADKFINITRGQMSFPLNIPGTSFHKSLQDKNKVLKIIKDIVQARRVSANNIHDDDFLSKMLKDMNKEKFLTEDFVTQQLFGLSFPSFESIPSILAFAMKFISENPDVLQELIVEHEEILKKRTDSSSLITWTEYKSMTFTLQIINETLRLGNITPGIFRKSLKDIHINGYMIPAGWGIMLCHSALHLDPYIYEDPLTFNPWRWKDVKSESMCKNLKPFGGGTMQCAGAEFSKASMIIFLHVLVTKYRWTVVKGGDIVQNPVMHFKNGLHISVYERTD